MVETLANFGSKLVRMFREAGPGPILLPEKLMSFSNPGEYAANFPPKRV